ncbi:hypothetical protein Ocin01_19670 [Orchesella cincta]|uniref:Secreted protein n=1 Tax=Orchesella cincta TaxID=48709 RepID=A0A1D2M244_ORCCI|nr:hypothetical protein Ocin01_19670 [Orchesella cincta]
MVSLKLTIFIPVVFCILIMNRADAGRSWACDVLCGDFMSGGGPPPDVPDSYLLQPRINPNYDWTLDFGNGPSIHLDDLQSRINPNYDWTLDYGNIPPRRPDDSYLLHRGK